MAVATSTAVIGAAVLGAGTAAWQGQQQRDAMQSAQRRTRQAQDEALRLQMIERQRAVQADMERANRPAGTANPLTDSLLSTTDRTGGLDDRLRLQRRTTLGGV